MALAKPSSLALIGFAFPTILLSICNAGIYEINAAILGLAISHGGLSQIIVGFLLFFDGATFGHVVFFSFGAFWWSSAVLISMPYIAPSAFPVPDGVIMGVYFLLWALFSFSCWVCTFKQNRIIFCIFLTLWPTFILLSISHWRDNMDLLKAGGWLGIICGSLALYLGLAELLNDSIGAVLLPIGEPKNAVHERRFLRNISDYVLMGTGPQLHCIQIDSSCKSSKIVPLGQHIIVVSNER